MPVTKSLVTSNKKSRPRCDDPVLFNTAGRCHRVECQGTTEENEGSRESGPSHGLSACKYPLECEPELLSAVIQPSAVLRPLRGSDVSSGALGKVAGVGRDRSSLVATPRRFPNFWSLFGGGGGRESPRNEASTASLLRRQPGQA